MDMSKRLFINVIPGKTFLDKLSGTTKVRLFFFADHTPDRHMGFPDLISGPSPWHRRAGLHQAKLETDRRPVNVYPCGQFV